MLVTVFCWFPSQVRNDKLQFVVHSELPARPSGGDSEYALGVEAGYHVARKTRPSVVLAKEGNAQKLIKIKKPPISERLLVI